MYAVNITIRPNDAYNPNSLVRSTVSMAATMISIAGSNHATVIDPTKECKTLKDRGITISVLYIPYQKISPVNTSFAGNEDTYANNNIPYIQPSLQACASPGFFYTADTPANITASLNQMFRHAVQVAHLTN